MLHFDRASQSFCLQENQAEVMITNFSHPVKTDFLGKETMDYCNVYVHTQVAVKSLSSAVAGKETSESYNLNLTCFEIHGTG